MIDHKKLCSLIVIWLENIGVSVKMGQADQYTHSVVIEMFDQHKRTIICYRHRTTVNSFIGPTCVSAIMYDKNELQTRYPVQPQTNVIRLNPEDPNFFDKIAKHLGLPTHD